ncbi:MAG: ribonuclease H-like domain-containing protein [Methanoregula sp.]|jgi:hypothetical protein|nr:ribonuclease H-like domain-containing protein [Methanoregula sp.]
MREYEVIRDGNVFSTSFSPSFVFSSEYEETRRYLKSLLARYQGISFNSVFHGMEEMNEGGTCFVQKSRHALSYRAVDYGRFRDEISRDLTLVHGIGLATQKKLNNLGYETLNDLLDHPRYRVDAGDVLSRLSDGNTTEIMNLIGGRHSRSHPCILGTAGMHEPEDFVFFDIETLGLFSRPIILFGVGSLENGQLSVNQYLLRDIEEEQAALLATVEHLSGDHPALVTFNGKSFDLPYLADRLAYYGLGSPADIPHFDMLHFSRRRWKGELPSVRLTALEKEILGIRRSDDIPGQMVPEFYETYQRSGNCGPLVPILEHNCQDVVSLAMLFFHLVGESYGCT